MGLNFRAGYATVYKIPHFHSKFKNQRDHLLRRVYALVYVLVFRLSVVELKVNFDYARLRARFHNIITKKVYALFQVSCLAIIRSFLYTLTQASSNFGMIAH